MDQAPAPAGLRAMIRRRVRIAVVETAPFGGLLHYAVQLADALAERGHRVDLLATRDNELAGRQGPARMRAVLVRPVSSSRPPSPGVAYLARRAGVAFRLAAAWGRIAWETRPARYDAMILNGDLALSLTAGASLALTAVPGRPALAAVCHNVRPYNRWAGSELFAASPLLAGLLRRLYPRLDVVFVHGERSREEFAATWPPSRLAVVPHGDERLFAAEPPPPTDDERILFFGDWRKVKGLPILMEAFDLLSRRRPTTRLTIAGTPSPADGDPGAVHAFAARHGGRVSIVDRYVPLEEVPATFGAARVVVTPYLVGYQSGVVHLAMTMARAVVASDVGDLSAVVVDGETGRLVPPGDPEALATVLEEVVSDAAGAARLGEEGRRRVLDSSSWEEVAARVEAELVGAGRVRGRSSPSAATSG